MEEKIIIKSDLSEAVDKIKVSMFILFILVALISFILLVGQYEVRWYAYGEYRTITENGFSAAFEGNSGCLVFFIIVCSLFLIAIFLLFLFLITRECSIVITENNVKGTAIFGKEVVLPLYMISAYSTRRLFSTIAVSTSSGITKFSMIKNYKEIGNELSRLINERQSKTTIYQQEDSDTNSAFVKIEKLKELLDKDIITQEEFDAKKKNLLGL